MAGQYVPPIIAMPQPPIVFRFRRHVYAQGRSEVLDCFRSVARPRWGAGQKEKEKKQSNWIQHLIESDTAPTTGYKELKEKEF